MSANIAKPRLESEALEKIRGKSAERYSRLARERAMRSINAGKHMTFAEALAEVMDKYGPLG